MTTVTFGKTTGEVDVRAGQAASRIVVVAALATCVATGPFAASASASTAGTATPPAVSTNWYWSAKAPVLPAGPALPTLPAEADQASGVPAGDLGVGYAADSGGAPDKIAAIGFDLTQIPAGSTFIQFTVTVPLDPAANQLQTAQPDLAACENIDAFVDAGGPSEVAKAPPISLPSCVKGVFNAAMKAYVFQLEGMANDWSGGAPSNGISVRPFATAPGAAPFSIAVKGKNGITVAAAYIAPDAPSVPVVPGPVVAPPPVLSGGGVPLPPTVPDVQPPAPQTVPVVPVPQVNPVPTTAPIAVRAAGYVPGTSTPSTLWWLALLGMLGLLGLTSVVLGDPMAPTVADPRRRRFADVVRARAQVAGPVGNRTSAPRIRPV